MRAFVAFLATILLVPACGGTDAATTPSAGSLTQEVVVRTADGEQSLTVRIADSDEERQHGLKGVRDLPANDGMAFVYDAPLSETFWSWYLAPRKAHRLCCVRTMAFGSPSRSSDAAGHGGTRPLSTRGSGTRPISRALLRLAEVASL